MFNDLVTCDILTWFSFLLVLVLVTWLITSTRVTAHIPIDNKSILITGCDSGFGHELAIKATARGFHVFACCLSQWSDGAASLVAKDCTVIEVDVTQQKTLDAALPVVEEVLASRGLVLHGVVNNAGLNLSLGPVEWVAPETIQKIFDVNTVGVVRVTRTFLPLVRKARGRIVNVCSMAGHIASPGLIPYCMSKGAVFMYTNGLRREMKAFGVCVSSISPTFYETPMTARESGKRMVQAAWDQAAPEGQEAYGGAKRHDALLKKIDRAPTGRPQTCEVTDCIMDALTNEHPKPDYIPDLKTRITTAVFEIIPLSWADYLLAKSQPKKK